MPFLIVSIANQYSLVERIILLTGNTFYVQEACLPYISWSRASGFKSNEIIWVVPQWKQLKLGTSREWPQRNSWAITPSQLAFLTPHISVQTNNNIRVWSLALHWTSSLSLSHTFFKLSLRLWFLMVVVASLSCSLNWLLSPSFMEQGQSLTYLGENSQLAA